MIGIFKLPADVAVEEVADAPDSAIIDRRIVNRATDADIGARRNRNRAVRSPDTSSLEKCRSVKLAARMEPSAWGLYWSNPGLGDSQNRVPQHRLQAEFGPVKSRGESACVYPPQPLESQTKPGSQSTKAIEPKRTWLESQSNSSHAKFRLLDAKQSHPVIYSIFLISTSLNSQHLNGRSAKGVRS